MCEPGANAFQNGSADSFIAELRPEESPLLRELREFAAVNNVPILRPDAAALLRTLTALKRPARVLEAGTAIGYSALLLSEAAPKAHIETVELDADTAALAMRNIDRAGRADRIRVILGDATEVFAALRGPYDMVFLDSAKGQYVRLLDDVLRLLPAGGLLVADNCLFYSKILDEPADAPHKHRTSVANLRAFLSRVAGSGEFEASLLPVGDGVLLAVRKDAQNDPRK